MAIEESLATSFWSSNFDQMERWASIARVRQAFSDRAAYRGQDEPVAFCSWCEAPSGCLLPACALQLRYANHSNYKNDTMIRKEANVAPAVLKELRRIIEDSDVSALCRPLPPLQNRLRGAPAGQVMDHHLETQYPCSLSDKVCLAATQGRRQ